MTGNYIYFFLDPEKVGEEHVVVGLIAFVSLLNICEFSHPKNGSARTDKIVYGVAYGMSGARDAITGPLEILGNLQLPK